MNISRLVFLRKDDSAGATCVNRCRVISIMPSFTKLAEGVILQQLAYRGIYSRISRAQTGFIPKLGTLVNVRKMIKGLLRLDRASGCQGVFFIDFS
jgi:hypothetical protein